MSTPDTPVRVGDERWKDLATIPSTNFQIVVAAVLTCLTAGIYLTMMILGRDGSIAEGVFNSWLIFLAAWAGISTGQFIGKRLTYAAPSPDSERAGVPATPGDAAKPSAPPSAPVAAVTGAAQAMPTSIFPLPTKATD